MDRLIALSEKKKEAIKPSFKRFLFETVDWTQRLILIQGYRGTGKTTLLLQRAAEEKNQTIYLSLDDIYFESFRLVELIDALYTRGYRYFFLDEVHRYIHWSKDLKNTYDNYPDVHIVATGSSVLEVSRGQADLSRRAVVYYLPGLSFREYLQLESVIELPALSLTTILQSHQDLTEDFTDLLLPEKHFKRYLHYGYYPFYQEGTNFYSHKLQQTTNLVIDLEIAPFEDLNHSTVRNIKKLLYIIGQSVPFTPNISKLSERINVPRNTILKILDLLTQARIISLLRKESRGISYLTKPEKIYLQNPNLAFILAEHKPDIGTIRETFILSQLEVNHRVGFTRFADFLIDDRYTIEVGGPNKTQEQIKDIPNAYLAIDGIKGGSGNRIPLWLFGLLY